MQKLIGAARAKLPPSVQSAHFQTNGRAVTLTVRTPPPPSVAHIYFYPEPTGLFDYSAEHVIFENGSLRLTLPLRRDADAAAVRRLSQLKGILVGAGASPLAIAAAAAPPEEAPGGGVDWSTLGSELLLAFVGGLILNLMPCVLPVLSLKAASLARIADQPSRARTEGALYALGVLLCFAALAATMVALRNAGESIGWGFQLQSPAIVACLALLMFAIGLNMSGIFEIGASIQNLGQARAGAFGAGVLAVAVAAPCSAPFMAAALGWAVAQTPIVTLAVFGALGVGFALPLTALCFIPMFARLLPKPGAWMAHLRSVLAFPMYAASAWLAWVLALQTQVRGLPYLLGAAIALAMAAWLYGQAQEPARPAIWLGASIIAVSASLSAAFASTAPPDTYLRGLHPIMQPWSVLRQQRLLAAHLPFFVEFTAAWCVTCQVNEATVLNTNDMRDALANAHVAYLRADWTSNDFDIASELAAHDRAGVPLYLLYDARGQVIVFPQILDEADVVRTILAARGPAPTTP